MATPTRLEWHHPLSAPIMLSQLIAHYGYLALFVGTLVEGETVLILAGFSAHRGWLDFPLVVAVAAAGGSLGDILAYTLGRWQGERLLARFPSLAARRGQVDTLLARFSAPIIVGIRFMYGLRVAGPVLLGVARVPAATFIGWNLAGALLWACVFGTLGYLFGEAALLLLGRIAHLEGLLFALLAALALPLLAWLRRRAHRAAAQGTR